MKRAPLPAAQPNGVRRVRRRYALRMTTSVGLGKLHCRQRVGKSRPLVERATPPWGLFLVAWALGRVLRFLHPFRHLCFQGVEVEAGAALDRWEIQESLNF